MIEIIHVSDLHFGKSRKQTRRALNLLDKIGRNYGFSADRERYLLVTGDITHHGRRKEYQLAGKALLPFRGKVLLTPGNHDYGSFFGTLFIKRSAKYFDHPFAKNLGFNHAFLNKRVFPQILSSTDDQTKLMVIGLNSCTYKDLEDFSRGRIGVTQLTELATILNTVAKKIPKLIFLHHIPDQDAEWENIMTLEDWKDLMKIVKGNVEIMAFGHQGKFRPTANEKDIPALSRAMKVRLLDCNQNDEIIMLDANDSTREQACYRILAEGGNRLTAEIIKLD